MRRARPCPALAPPAPVREMRRRGAAAWPQLGLDDTHIYALYPHAIGSRSGYMLSTLARFVGTASAHLKLNALEEVAEFALVRPRHLHRDVVARHLRPPAHLWTLWAQVWTLWAQ
eukprot:731145-Prorocentrum_minimum.AAC.1